LSLATVPSLASASPPNVKIRTSTSFPHVSHIADDNPLASQTSTTCPPVLPFSLSFPVFVCVNKSTHASIFPHCLSPLPYFSREYSFHFGGSAPTPYLVLSFYRTNLFVWTYNSLLSRLVFFVDLVVPYVLVLFSFSFFLV